MDNLKIYAASRTRHAPMWRRLRSEGWPIISTWIDEAESGQTADRAELATRCIREASEAHITVVYGEQGEQLKGALIEMGAAMANGHPVVLVGECLSPTSVFLEHPEIWPCVSIEAAAIAINLIVAGSPAAHLPCRDLPQAAANCHIRTGCTDGRESPGNHREKLSP